MSSQVAPLRQIRQFFINFVKYATSDATREVQSHEKPVEKQFYLLKMHPELARSHKPSPQSFEYNFRDGILYALGIGAKATDLQWIYEGNQEFHLFPTYVIVPGLLSHSLNDWPGIDFDLSRILHGEQYIEVFEPLPKDGRLICQVSVPDVVDKGSGALILTDVNISGSSGKKLAYLQIGLFQVGSGGFGGLKKSSKVINGVPPPNRNPDNVTEDKVSFEQAALYRLGSRDMNPLHVDPNFAKLGGFKQPILHGMCTLGFSVRHVINIFAGGDARKFKAVKARFTSPVDLGSTLIFEMWKEGKRVHFQTKIKETNKFVIQQAFIDLTEETKI